MRIDPVPEWALGPREPEVAALLARGFGTGFGGRSFFKQRHHLRLLAWDPGLVGHVALGWRAVRLGGRLLDAATLGEVATDPARRGEGIAGRLVARAIGEARAGGAAAALLFGGAGLYGALGFRPAANPVRHLAVHDGRSVGLREERDGSLMVLPLDGAPWDEAAVLDLLGPMF